MAKRGADEIDEDAFADIAKRVKLAHDELKTKKAEFTEIYTKRMDQIDELENQARVSRIAAQEVHAEQCAAIVADLAKRQKTYYTIAALRMQKGTRAPQASLGGDFLCGFFSSREKAEEHILPDGWYERNHKGWGQFVSYAVVPVPAELICNDWLTNTPLDAPPTFPVCNNWKVDDNVPK
jgi:hypothetical protein